MRIRPPSPPQPVVARRRAPIALLGALFALLMGAGIAGAADAPVTIAGFAFDPADLQVSVGDTVTWTNQDTAPHTATADDGTFASTNLAQGESFSFTFASPGTFAYHCAVHPRMTAQIVVAAASGTAPSTDVAAGDPPSDDTAALAVLLIAAVASLGVAVLAWRRAGRTGA